MSVRTEALLNCDNCGDYHEEKYPASTEAAAIALATEDGWLCSPDADLCPNCAKEAAQR